MATALKCPNPSCTFLFDPTQVPVGAILSCPQCAMRFTLGPPPPTPPQHLPVGLEATRSFDAMPPVEQTLAQSSTAATEQRPAEMPTEQKAERTPPRKRQQRENPNPFPWGTLIGIMAVAATATAVGAYLLLQVNPGGGSSGVSRYEDRNVSYRFPTANWETDDETRSLLSGNLFGLRRTEGGAFAALEARDFKTRNPQPGELKEGVRSRLKSLFDDYDPTEVDDVTWAGQRATRTIIRGSATPKLGAGVYVGEVYAMGHKGVGYWFVAVAPESQAATLAAELPDLLDRMTILTQRENWKESTTGTNTLVGREADYRLSDGDGWWKTLSDPHFEDTNADQVFDAEFRFRTKVDFKPKARVTVLNLPATSDEPITVLRGYLKEQYQKQFDLKNWAELSEPPLGDWPSSGEQRGVATFRYKVTGTDANTAKLVILSAIKLDVTTKNGREPRIIGAHATCAWEHQQYWEKRLIQMATSLRAAGM